MNLTEFKSITATMVQGAMEHRFGLLEIKYSTLRGNRYIRGSIPVSTFIRAVVEATADAMAQELRRKDGEQAGDIPATG